MGIENHRSKLLTAEKLQMKYSRHLVLSQKLLENTIKDLNDNGEMLNNNFQKTKKELISLIMKEKNENIQKNIKKEVISKVKTENEVNITCENLYKKLLMPDKKIEKTLTDLEK